MKAGLALACGLALAACAAAAGPPAASAVATATGERLYQRCVSCHSLEAGENLPSGPTLHGVIGKKVAVEKFDYSPALRAFAERYPRWTRALVDRFIADPEALVPGTYMSFHGIADPVERAALIAFLERQAFSGGETAVDTPLRRQRRVDSAD